MTFSRTSRTWRFAFLTDTPSGVDRMNARPLCVIVGAEEGLGASLAAAFAAEGCDLALLSPTLADSREALGAARKARPDGRAVTFDCDPATSEAVERALVGVAQDMGPIDVLIYNVRPAVAFIPPLEITPTALRDMLEIEAVAAFAAARTVLPKMIEHGAGTLIFTSATAALRGAANGLTFATSKFALRGMAQSLAKAYASKGIHVVHVRLDCYLDDAFARRTMGEQFREEFAAKTSDVAQAYLHAYKQPRSAWSNEIELRPHRENWTF
ncbi:MAG: SDR family NAD(P)-dependent oxidoreductase [Panacagrimonas sp.]